MEAPSAEHFHWCFRNYFHVAFASSASSCKDLVSSNEAVRNRAINAREAGATPAFAAPCVTALFRVAPASREEFGFWRISKNLKEISRVERHIFRAKRRIDIYRRRFCSDLFYGGSSMSRPPSPTNLPPIHARRLEQSLTCLAPGVSGAALLPVLPQMGTPRILIHSQRTRPTVKFVRISSFTSHFTFHFTSRLSNLMEGGRLQNALQETARLTKHQNGRERPHFSGFNPPKKFSRSLPPVSEVRHGTPPDRSHKCFECIASVHQFSHGDLNESCITACMAGPQEGEPPQCQS